MLNKGIQDAYNKSKCSNLKVSIKTELHFGKRSWANLCAMRYVYRLSAEYGIIPGGLVGSWWRSPRAIVRGWMRGAIRRLV